jgi:anti-sigma factor ChrR (cupin superfamily)
VFGLEKKPTKHVEPEKWFIKLDPSAVVSLHEHTALEHAYVFEGTPEDHEGMCGPGQFVWRPPAPWSADCSISRMRSD